MRRGLLVLGLTAALGGGLFAVDRLVLGLPAPRGWVEVSALAEVPATAGPTPFPSYLPDALGWPPRRIFYRTEDGPGVWLEVRRGDEGVLWLGTDHPDPPAALGALAACATGAECPPPWRAARAGPFVAITSLDERELGRIARQLGPATR